MYRHIKELLGNPQPLFTQVDTPSAPPPAIQLLSRRLLPYNMNWSITYWPATVGIPYSLWKLYFSQILFYIML